MLCQYLMSQTKIIGGISCGFLHREQSHNPLHLRQIRRFIAGIPCRCRNVQDNTVVCVQGLVAQAVHPLRLIGAIEPACVWICLAYPPVGVFWFPFQNFYPFLFCFPVFWARYSPAFSSYVFNRSQYAPGFSAASAK